MYPFFSRSPAGVQLEETGPVPACHGQGQTLGVGLPVLIGLLQEAGAVIPVQAAVRVC